MIGFVVYYSCGLVRCRTESTPSDPILPGRRVVPAVLKTDRGRRMWQQGRGGAIVFAIQDRVNYGAVGVCTVVDIRWERIGGSAAEYYVLEPIFSAERNCVCAGK